MAQRRLCRALECGGSTGGPERAADLGRRTRRGSRSRSDHPGGGGSESQEGMSAAPPKKYYITTPIYYVNGLPHVGSALTTIACDVLARYHRLRGQETWFLTGVDENATKVQEAAEKAGVPTLQFVDDLAEAFRVCWHQL